MSVERTLGIVKPDAVKRNLIGEILRRAEGAGLKIIAAQLQQLTKAKAEGFYAVHKERPFFPDLVTFMTSGPCLPFVLEGEGAIATWRELMGTTDPKKAAPATIRAAFGTSIQNNCTHGSDSPETARFETGYFFPSLK